MGQLPSVAAAPGVVLQPLLQARVLSRPLSVTLPSHPLLRSLLDQLVRIALKVRNRGF